MKWLIFFIIITLLTLLYLYERNRMDSKKERSVLLLILIISGVIVGLTVFFPKIPGPTKWVEAIFKPFINE